MSVESLVAYFPLSWETFHPSFCTNMLKGAICMHRFATSPKCIANGFVIMVFNRHNISATWFSLIIIGIPCATNSMASTFNWIINYENLLMIRCLMGVNLRVIKLESPIDFAQATSLLITQLWHLSIWLNISLTPLEKIFLLLSFSSLASIPSSSLFCSIIIFCPFLFNYENLFASSLFTLPFILPKTKSFVDLLIFCTLWVIWMKWKKIKCKGWNGKEGPTFIFGGPIELFVKHGVGYWILIWAMHCTFSLDSANTLLPKRDINSLMPFVLSFLLDSKNVVLSKHDIGSLMPFSRSFSLDTISMKRQ